MDYLPMRDKASDYLGRSPKTLPAYEAACVQLGILKDMKIKLTQAEIEHLFSLRSEVAIMNYCHKIKVERL